MGLSNGEAHMAVQSTGILLAVLVGVWAVYTVSMLWH
jgi:hypothetical protein